MSALKSIDWTVLRRALGIFGICFLVSAVLLGASFYFRDEMRSVYNDHQARFKTVSRKYLAVDEEERVIKRHYPAFVELYKQGVLGPEHRLHWLETLRAAGELVKLPNLVYQIDSQEPWVPTIDVGMGRYQIYGSKMELNLGMLHEYDLINVFNILDHKAEGQYSVERCEIKKTRPELVMKDSAENLTALCDLRWFTVDLQGEKLVMDANGEDA
jgi:hypothetical protein